MSKLRRHDWRDHRELPCNICGDLIVNRRSISNHRITKHQIFKKVLCRFYPDCLDEDECVFAHENRSQFKENSSYCQSGVNCSDQACKFSESQHKNVKQISCRFQANCTRKFCYFQHSVERIAFLGEGNKPQAKT